MKRLRSGLEYRLGRGITGELGIEQTPCSLLEGGGAYSQYTSCALIKIARYRQCSADTQTRKFRSSQFSVLRSESRGTDGLSSLAGSIQRSTRGWRKVSAGRRGRKKRIQESGRNRRLLKDRGSADGSSCSARNVIRTTLSFFE